MKYRIAVNPVSKKFLEEGAIQFTEVRNDGNHVMIDVEIETPLDLLGVFHAGINYGVAKALHREAVYE